MTAEFKEYADELANYGERSSEIVGFAMTNKTFMDKHRSSFEDSSGTMVAGVKVKEVKSIFGRTVVIDESVPEGEVMLLMQRHMDEYQSGGVVA